MENELEEYKEYVKAIEYSQIKSIFIIALLDCKHLISLEALEFIYDCASEDNWDDVKLALSSILDNNYHIDLDQAYALIPSQRIEVLREVKH
jgi:hypothetical protein